MKTFKFQYKPNDLFLFVKERKLLNLNQGSLQESVKGISVQVHDFKSFSVYLRPLVYQMLLMQASFMRL